MVRTCVQVQQQQPVLSTWVIGFMAALDDVAQREASHGSGRTLRHSLDSRSLARTGPHAANILAMQAPTQETPQGPPPPATPPPPCQEPAFWTPTCVNTTNDLQTRNLTAPPPPPASQRHEWQRKITGQLQYGFTSIK